MQRSLSIGSEKKHMEASHAFERPPGFKHEGAHGGGAMTGECSRNVPKNAPCVLLFCFLLFESSGVCSLMVWGVIF